MLLKYKHTYRGNPVLTPLSTRRGIVGEALARIEFQQGVN